MNKDELQLAEQNIPHIVLKNLKLIIKSMLDIAVACILFVLLLPLFILIGIAIKMDSSGPVFFKQQRVGLNGKPFTIYKFRTMVDNAISMGTGYALIDNDPRITFTGRFLREWSLDELPQLINIARGEMSIIGPRPTLQYQVDNYTSRQRKRLEMKPGVTGLAQVNGRNNIPWEDRIEMDIRYVENWSLLLDLRIFFRTFKAIFRKSDIYNQNGYSYDFKGGDDNSDNNNSKE